MLLQLKVMVRDVNPSVWRRFRMADAHSVADLHQVIQLLLGWHDDHLHCFRIQGADYGASYDGGLGFSEDAADVPLSRFGFRPSERFLYEYDFTAGWQVEIRVEKRLEDRHGEQCRVPVCIDGREPEAWLGHGGPSNYSPPRPKGLSRQAREDMATVVLGLRRVIDGNLARSDLREPGSDFARAFRRMKARLALRSDRFPCAKFNAALRKTFSEDRSSQ